MRSRLRECALILFLLFTFFLLPAAHGQKPAVAVVVLAPAAGDEASADFSDWVRYALVKSGGFGVMGRGRMESLLAARGFPYPPAGDSLETLVAMGNALGVSEIIGARANRVGDVYQTTVRWIDVPRETIAKEILDEGRADAAELIVLSARGVARLTGERPDETRESVEKKPARRRTVKGTSRKRVSRPRPSALININTASPEELEALPGIGPKKAGMIAKYRVQNGPFPSVDEIVRVKGIGPKTLGKLRPYITAE